MEFDSQHPWEKAGMLTHVHNSSPRELKTGGILCGLCGQPAESKRKFPDLCEKYSVPAKQGG